MNKIRMVIFDLDGTLLDTLEDIRSAISYVLKCYDMGYASYDDTRRYVGHGFANALRCAVNEKSSTAVDENEFALMLALLRRRYERSAAEHTEPYAGITELLMDLNSHGIEIGVLTNKDDKIAKALIHAFFPDINFTFIEGKKESRALKPSAALTLSILEEHGIDKSEVVIVGDSEVDKETADNIGAPSIIVSYGFRDKEQLMASGIEKTCENVSALSSSLAELCLLT